MELITKKTLKRYFLELKWDWAWLAMWKAGAGG